MSGATSIEYTTFQHIWLISQQMTALFKVSQMQHLALYCQTYETYHLFDSNKKKLRVATLEQTCWYTPESILFVKPMVVKGTSKTLYSV